MGLGLRRDETHFDMLAIYHKVSTDKHICGQFQLKEVTEATGGQ